MKATLNKLENCKVELIVETDAESWKKALEAAKRKVSANLNIKGFRKGHIPPAIAEKYLDLGRIQEEAFRQILNPAFQEGIRQTGYVPYTQAEPEVIEMKEEGPVIKFTYIHGPMVTLGKTSGWTAEHPVASVTEEEIAADINRRLESSASLTVVEREAKLGDSVVIDFVGYVDGKAFEGGSAENYELELGSNSFVPGFEEQLVGTKSEDEKDINITFPEQYVAELAGKAATFHVKVHEVKERVIPTLSDEAVLDLNLRDVKTVDELKEYVRKELLQKKVNEIEQAYLNAIVDQIVADAVIEYPEQILIDEANSMIDSTKRQIEQNGLSYEQFLQITGSTPEAHFESQKVEAKKNLDHYFVIDRLCREEGLNPTRDEVEAELRRQAEAYKIDVNQLRKYYGDNLERLANDLRSSKLTRWLLENNPYQAPKAEEEAPKKAPAKKAAAKKAAAKKEEAPAEEPAKEEAAEEKKPAKKPAAKKAPAKKAKPEGEGE